MHVQANPSESPELFSLDVDVRNLISPPWLHMQSPALPSLTSPQQAAYVESLQSSAPSKCNQTLAKFRLCCDVALAYMGLPEIDTRQTRKAFKTGTLDGLDRPSALSHRRIRHAAVTAFIRRLGQGCSPAWVQSLSSSCWSTRLTSTSSALNRSASPARRVSSAEVRSPSKDAIAVVRLKISTGCRPASSGKSKISCDRVLKPSERLHKQSSRY